MGIEERNASDALEDLIRVASNRPEWLSVFKLFFAVLKKQWRYLAQSALPAPSILTYTDTAGSYVYLQLTPCSTASQLAKKFPATGPYPESDESSSHPPTLFI
jgi:hypothetical protein